MKLVDALNTFVICIFRLQIMILISKPLLYYLYYIAHRLQSPIVIFSYPLGKSRQRTPDNQLYMLAIPRDTYTTNWRAYLKINTIYQGGKYTQALLDEVQNLLAVDWLSDKRQ